MNAKPSAPVFHERLLDEPPRNERSAERHLRALVEKGLPLVPRPWRALASQCGLTEEEVMACMRRWQAGGLVKRLGLVVHHRRLGITANAMVVWNLPDDEVSAVGRRLAMEPAVTLCYRRPRRLPDWPYNLFCMIHGVHRERVLTVLDEIRMRQALEAVPHRVLFSLKAYRQRGGRYTCEDSA